jgi:hypothetical protein
VRRVDVDVEQLVVYCKNKGMDVDAAARADYAAERLQRGGGSP